MSRTLSPLAVASHNLDEQIQSMLREGENVQARVEANGRFADWLESLPIVRRVLEPFRGRFELVVTNRRFIAIRVSRATRRVKSCRACAVHHMLALKLLKGVVQCELRFRFADGKVLGFGLMSGSKTEEFLDQFPAGSFANALASTLNETKPTPADRAVARVEYRAPAV